MKLEKILSWSESFTDEVQTEGLALAFANKAISDINTEAGTLLPFIDSIEEDYTALPESWFVRFMLSYLNYGIKMNDASLTEAMQYKMEFEIALAKFKDRVSELVAEEFIDTSSPKTYKIDTSNAIDIGWFGGWD